jgi:hypothetical protein
MNKLWVAGILFAFGCSKDVTKDIENLADKACACKDKDCATKALNEFVDFVDKNKNEKGDPERAQKAAMKLGECAIKQGVDLSTIEAAVKKLD